ncbi:hypothetical protein TIFTF001_012661 [Ficus carica]|uniref:non-specific serine/threonine protein kinase n=1 Tax=Ficus carica TaxID=3494 RepID=A0AA87ZZE5_FICCA|nr:hypothetical protein TIFTF001_012661 [Ficus carica]
MLPPELVNLTYLERVDFTRNFLHGSLPAIWSTMKYLNHISLTANRLSGEIPKEWGNFPSLTYLSIEANNLSGAIPEELGNLVNLTNLHFSSNKFVGTLPKSLANLKKLTDFRLSDNYFEGPIPDFIANFTRLIKLQLYATGLEGPIPAGIFQKLENLTDLRITDMAGPKSEFPDLQFKQEKIFLVLRNVNLSGTIPTKIWESISSMIMLFLAGNKFKGSVPNSFLVNSKIDNMYVLIYIVICPIMTLLGQIPRAIGEDRRSSLHINCGGPSVTIKNDDGSLSYDGDITDGYAAAKSHTGKYWGFSSTGDFMDDGDDIRNYIVENKDLFGDSKPLYTTARRSPLSLTYFACLENGTYTVKLHFAELIFGKFSGIGKRIFDIYIQV